MPETPRIDVGVIDSADPLELAGWWPQLLGGEVREDEDGDVELRGGPVNLLFLAVPGAKAGKNRLHLDLRTSDYAAAIARASDLGATPADDVYVGDRWRVLRDPEGSEFCIIRPT